MTERQRALLVANGALIFILGLMAGFPFAFAVIEQQSGGDVGDALRAWRMAHLEGLLNAIVIFVVVAIAPLCAISQGAARLAFWGLLAMGWTNIIASSLGAYLAVRGMNYTGMDANSLVYGLFTLGILGGIAAIVVVAHGAFATARQL